MSHTIQHLINTLAYTLITLNNHLKQHINHPLVQPHIFDNKLHNLLPLADDFGVVFGVEDVLYHLMRLYEFQ